MVDDDLVDDDNERWTITCTLDTLGIVDKRSAPISRGSVVWYGSKFGTTTNEALR